MTTAERLRNYNWHVDDKDAILNAADELEALTTELSAWKTSFGTQQLSHAVAEREALTAEIAGFRQQLDAELENETKSRAERDDLKAKLAQVEADAAVLWSTLVEIAEYWNGGNGSAAVDAAEHCSELADSITKNKQPGQRLLDELVALRATAQRRLKLLRKCEWGMMPGAICRFCRSTQHEGHKPDCPLAQELKEGK